MALNTQTHLLLGLAALAPLSARHRASNRSGLLVLAILAGALLPDASLFVMWGYAKFTGVAEATIWSELYYSDFWQQAGAMTNSIPVFLFTALLGLWLGGRMGLQADVRSFPSNGGSPPGLTGTALLLFSLSALLHALADLPLHHDDGHPHFWPFSNWIFSSPVSYWDGAHHGNIWRPVELCLAGVLLLLLWRRFRSILSRLLLILVGLSYLLAAGYWFNAF